MSHVQEAGMDKEGRPGRPRDPQVDRAILEATLKLLSEQGFGGMSVEGVASEAGVGKTTIYRRYASKEELVVAAVSSLRDPSLVLPDGGSLRSDIAGMMAQNRTVLEEGLALMGALLVEESRNPELLAMFRKQTFRRRRDEAVKVLQRSVDRGEIRPDINPEAAVHAIVGSMFVRCLLGIPETDEWISRTVEIICRGVMNPSSR